MKRVHQHQKMHHGIGMMLFLLITLSGAQALSQNVKDRRVGLWVLDHNPATRAVSKSVASTLEKNNYQVIQSTELQRTLARIRAQKPSTKELVGFQGMSGLVAKGIKAYFYGGEQHKQAITQLQPLFDLGMKRIKVLGFRSDMASQIYEAGAVLLRAYADNKDRANRKRIARQLALNFPHHLPDKKSIPQEIIDLVELERTNLAKQNTYIFLEMKGKVGTSCQLFLNGIPAIEKTKIVVDADLTYYVHMTCGQMMTPYVLPVKGKRGQTVTVPIVDRDPFGFVMQDDSFDNRAIATSHMAFILYWTNIDQFVGLSRSRQKVGDESFLLVRMAPNKGAIWSDGTTNKTVLKLLASVFPEIEVKDEPVKPPPKVKSAPVWPWVALSAGVLTSVVGGGLTYYWHQDVTQYRCTPDTNGRVDTGCEGVDGLNPPQSAQDASQFNEDWDAAINRRWIGVGVLSAGAVLTVTGIVGLLTTDDEPQPVASWTIQPMADGANVSWTTSF